VPFSKDDTDRIRVALASAMASQSLTAWQRTFLSDMQVRFDKYGTRTQLSDKQYDKLKQILAPFESPQPSIRSQTPNPRPKAAPAKSQPIVRHRVRYRTPLPLRAIRRVRRTARQITWFFLAAFGLIALLSGVNGSGGPTSPERMVSTMPTGGSQVYGARDFAITDGDTVGLHGSQKGTRLVGFNTPETFEPRCDRELALGRQATARLKELVKTADRVELRLVACACQPGTQGTNDCNFGRSCGVLTVDGRDVGDILIREGLAARFQCGRTSCPPTPRPWCG
jgi:micrococcal nuclease